MKNYVVVIDRIFSYRMEIQAEDEADAEFIARCRMVEYNTTPYDYNESINATEEEEVG